MAVLSKIESLVAIKILVALRVELAGLEQLREPEKEHNQYIANSLPVKFY